MIFRVIYYVLQAYVVFLATMGTWRLAKSTADRGTWANVSEYGESEKKYKPLKDLNPARIIEICKWFISWRNEPEGVADLVILKRQFNWGLRFLMVSIVLQFMLLVIKELGDWFLLPVQELL